MTSAASLPGSVAIYGMPFASWTDAGEEERAPSPPRHNGHRMQAALMRVVALVRKELLASGDSNGCQTLQRRGQLRRLLLERVDARQLHLAILFQLRDARRLRLNRPLLSLALSSIGGRN